MMASARQWDMKRLAGYGMLLLYVSAALLYLAYFAFILSTGQTGIDYDTFMRIGDRFRADEPIWTENSYYPLPYVIIFGWFSALPVPVSILLWHLVPVLAALWIARGRPWPLLFAPLFAHLVGGQTAVFAMVGLHVYYRYHQDWRGGIGLALLLLKPQLGLFVLLWAGIEWLRELVARRRITPQALVFAALGLLLIAPTFLIIPDWVSQWLSQARPLFIRAMAAFIPRSILLLVPEGGAVYWGLLALLGGLLLGLVWWLAGRRLSLDHYLLTSFIINPFVHDYDLIQLIPLLHQPSLQRTAIVASIPTWLVIALAYGVDSAWFVVTLIVPCVLAVSLVQARKGSAATMD